MVTHPGYFYALQAETVTPRSAPRYGLPAAHFGLLWIVSEFGCATVACPDPEFFQMIFETNTGTTDEPLALSPAPFVLLRWNWPPNWEQDSNVDLPGWQNIRDGSLV